MLELVTRHGAFDLTIRVKGDLDVDQHHTVEDLGIALGEAVSAALGTRRGINRAGYFVMPMDETLGVAAIDLGGRPHAVVDLRIRTRLVGDLQSELIHDFFEGFAIGARANVHVKVLYGRSSHHQVEAIFSVRKGAPRCLRKRQADGEDAAEHEGPPVNGSQELVIALIDYGAGNLTSVKKALAALGADVSVPQGIDDLLDVSGVIVPGVGNFKATEAMTEEWREAIIGVVGNGRPLLGICLGLQWLFEGSAEAPDCKGLGLMSGLCDRLLSSMTGPDGESQSLKIPHVGWNSLHFPRRSMLFEGVDEGSQVYFTHSYAAPVSQDASAITTYGVPFASAVERGQVFGVQFHPEKSGDVGLQVLKNFLELTLSLRMLSKRIIACLDVRDGQVVKGVQFEGLRSAGDPAELAARYNAEGIDEVVILDITATLEKRRTMAETVSAVAKQIFIPLTVGGGIRSADDAAAAVDAGADKVSLNTAAL